MNIKKFINPLYISLTIYLIIVGLLVYFKPLVFFDENGNVRKTGFTKNRTIFSFNLLLVFISIIIYFFITFFFYFIKKILEHYKY